jgi:hypothetical protein
MTHNIDLPIDAAAHEASATYAANAAALIAALTDLANRCGMYDYLAEGLDKSEPFELSDLADVLVHIAFNAKYRNMPFGTGRHAAIITQMLRTMRDYADLERLDMVRLAVGRDG